MFWQLSKLRKAESANKNLYRNVHYITAKKGKTNKNAHQLIKGSNP
jgi:hypothetical protein